MAQSLPENEGIASNSGFVMARAPTVASRTIKRDMLPAALLGSLLYLITPSNDFFIGQTLNADGGKVDVCSV